METINAEQLKQMRERNEDFVLVNTLDEAHFEKTKIPGAVNIPQSEREFVQRVQTQAGSKNKKIVTYCASTECKSSEQGAEKLEAAGFTNVYDFQAGARGWTEAGEKLGAG